ncbi:MAG TPA: acyltransferase family protein [Caldilineaceae bacterium]|nr:acyltransferase family protein [Caldilineaceae bacterium]
MAEVAWITLEHTARSEKTGTVQPSDAQSREQATTLQRSRLFFIDHLRAALVILVVLHHVAVIYGEGTAFYYVDPASQESLTYLFLLVFVLANQAWFMGTLFLLAGYFTPGSYDRKGAGAFLKDRLLRLGIPIILWIFVLGPLTSMGFYLEPNPRIAGPLSWQSFWQTYPYLLGLGPLWFVALLLIFSVGYVAWRLMMGNRATTVSNSPAQISVRTIGLFALALALVSYLFRTIVPLGQSVHLFVDFLDFPTFAYLPQYLSFFVVGVVASRYDWFEQIPRSQGIIGFVAAMVAMVLLFPVAFFGGLPDKFLGNGHWQSALYTLWDSMLAVGLCLAVIPFFRRFFNGQGHFGSFLARHSYAVYILHSPIIVLVAWAVQGIDVEPWLKFGIVAAIGVSLSFLVAYGVRKVPYASRIL